jgi:hypothetical protein
MIRALLVPAVLAALAAPALAADHLVSPQAADQQLRSAEAARARDLATVDSFVRQGEGARALAGLGVDPSTVQRALPTLSDSELSDLAARANALQTDPVAALDKQVIWIGAIALAAIIIIIIVA